MELLEDSIRLGIKILESGFKPHFIVGIWRGGTPIGIAVQEFLDYYGIKTDHISIRTSYYSGINQINKSIRVHGLGYIVKNSNAEDKLLIVDDVYDTGLSIQAVLSSLKEKMRKNIPSNIQIATIYYKPNQNKTQREPNFYLYKTDQWLVFPHELMGLTHSEITQHKPWMAKLMERIKKDEN